MLDLRLSEKIKLFPQRHRAKGLTSLTRALFLTAAMLFVGRSSPGQCPPLDTRPVIWEAEDLDAHSKEQALIAIRNTLALYCEIADFFDYDTGEYSEEKGRAFLELIGTAPRILDDLQVSEVTWLTPGQYRDKVYKYFYQTGVQFRLKEPILEEVRYTEQFLVARIQVRKQQLNGLDRRYNYRDYSGNLREVPIIMEIRLSKSISADTYQAAITSISGISDEARSITVGRYLDIHLGGLQDIRSGWNPAAPWTALNPPEPTHRAVHIEGQYAAPIGKGENWYWSLGLGLRFGQAVTRLQEDLTIQTTQSSRQLGQALLTVPFTQQWQYNAGTEIRLAYTAVLVPIGIRWNPNPDFRREWLIDLHLLPGYAILSQDFEGDIALAYGYGGYLDCSQVANYRRGDVRSNWTAPMVHLRLSPAYYGTISSWSRSSKNMGWFIRADIEMALLSIFNRQGATPWVSLEGLPDGQSQPVFDHTASILHSKHNPLLVGARGGLFWKFF